MGTKGPQTGRRGSMIRIPYGVAISAVSVTMNNMGHHTHNLFVSGIPMDCTRGNTPLLRDDDCYWWLVMYQTRCNELSIDRCQHRTLTYIISREDSPTTTHTKQCTTRCLSVCLISRAVHSVNVVDILYEHTTPMSDENHGMHADHH